MLARCHTEAYWEQKKKAEMNQRSENCVQCEARHKQKQAPHQTKSIIDAIS